MFPLKRTAADDQLLNKEALDWFVRRRGSDWQADDERQFEVWLIADSCHAAAYRQCEAQWQELDAMPADLVARMRARLAQDKAREAAQVPNAGASRRSFLMWPAASAMVAAAGSVGYVAWQQLQHQPVSIQAFQTQRGQQQVVSLEDGSRLRLDTQTKVEVRFFRQRREVHLLDGQAVFEVQTDGRPFHVLADATRVTVVGTRFAVRYTPQVTGNTHVNVVVEEGRVRVAPLQQAEIEQGSYDLQAGVLLMAGQQVVCNAYGGAGVLMPVPADGMAPWRDQRVSFVDVPLLQALTELERYSETGLRINDPTVASMRLSGSFDPMAVTALYKALPRVLPVVLQEKSGFTEVVRAN